MEPVPSDDEVLAEEVDNLLMSPRLVDVILEDIEALGVTGEKELALALYLVGVSRLLEQPLAAIVQGPSSSGKSFLISQVASLFPPEQVLQVTQMTPQALYHAKPGSLRHVFVVAGERTRLENDDTAAATKALREMISEGVLRKFMPVKNSEGKIVTELVEQEGPIAYVESTTAENIFLEDANRCLMLRSDETEEQTRRILEAQAELLAGGARCSRRAKQVRAKHRALQRRLKGVPVIIPYSKELSSRFPVEQVEARRLHMMLGRTIAASALLHQRQRTVTADGLVATTEDYRIALQALQTVFMTSLGIGDGPSEAANSLLQRLRAWATAPFSLTDLQKLEPNIPRTTLQRLLQELKLWGLLVQVYHSGGRRPSIYSLTSGSPIVGSVLPTPEELAVLYGGTGHGYAPKKIVRKTKPGGQRCTSK